MAALRLAGSGRGGDPIAGAATFTANGCVACHGVAGNGVTGPAIQRESARRIFRAVREGPGPMPVFPELSRRAARDLAAFLFDPANTGASPPTHPDPSPIPDPTPVPTPTPVPAAPTWSSRMQALFTTKCATCHTGGSAPQGIRLNTYELASANASRALSEIRADAMPPSGPLPAADAKALEDWIAAGKPR